MSKRLALPALVTVCLALGGSEGAVAQSSFGSVTIGNSAYLTGSVLEIASRIPRTTAVRFALTAIRSCQSARAYGFVSTQRVAGGVVGWVPANLSGCFGVAGGGPGSSACLRAYRTPRQPDPTGVSGGRSLPSYYVLFAATSPQTCADLSTQVPGGVWARLSVAAGGLSRGSVIVVKCQRNTTGGLFDYVAPYSTALPASKRAFWVADRNVATGGDRLPGVPTC
jgi:hypothetical protein